MLNPPLAPWGRVDGFRVTPNGAHVVYTVDQTTNEVYELFGVPSDGSEPAVRINADLVPNGDVKSYALSSDSIHVAFVANQEPGGAFVYVGRVDGAAPHRVSGAMVANGNAIGEPLFTPDAGRIVYRADALVNEVVQLFSAPADGSFAPTLLSGHSVAGGDVASFAVSGPAVSSDARAVYRADSDVNDQIELFSVPVDGSAPPARLSGAMIAAGDVIEVEISADGSRVLFEADAAVDGRFDLYAVPISSAEPPSSIHSPVTYPYLVSADGVDVLYVAQETPGFSELYRRPADASTSAVNVNGSLSQGDIQGDVHSFLEHPTDGRVVYKGDQEIDERFELVAVQVGVGTEHVRLNDPSEVEGSMGVFRPDRERVVYVQRPGAFTGELLLSVPIDRSEPPVRLSPPLDQGRIDQRMHLAPDGQRVVFLAGTQYASDSKQLYVAPVDGSTPAVVLSGSIVAHGDVTDAFAVSPDGSRVAYVADADTDELFEL